jgi:uncharacterized protein
MSDTLGRVLEITRYPVKSMAGERRAVAEIDWQGVEGDRQYGFVRRVNSTRFPWFTARDQSDLVRYRASYDDPDNPRTSPVTITTPDGARHSVNDPALVEALSAAAKQPLSLMQLGIGAYDLMPISIVTTASLANLNAAHGMPIDRRRFRANILVESDFVESEWRGQRVQIGDGDDSAELLMAYPAPRCAMITIDPDTAHRDANILRTVAQDFGNAFTMYASVARPGVIREGDLLQIDARVNSSITSCLPTR